MTIRLAESIHPHRNVEQSSSNTQRIGKGEITEITLPLIDLYLPEDSFGFQLIDDYWFWFWNWR